ncbi:MAG TPA: hypothetical protein VHS99_08925 [Chloroflexota bacterium]|nr:hypothetical protein [Chloroflexota bacterium]
MTRIPLKQALVAGGAAVLIGASAAGAALAQQAPTPTPTQTQSTATPTQPAATATRPPATATPQGTPQGTPQPGSRNARFEQYLTALANRLGVTVDRLRQAMQEARQEVGIPTPGAGGHHGRSDVVRGARISFDVAAQAIGISPEQLRQELPGRSLNDVARAHNVDPARVASALKADAATRIDQAQRNGRLTAEQAEQLKQRTNTAVDELMGRTFPVRAARGQGARPSPTPTN